MRRMSAACWLQLSGTEWPVIDVVGSTGIKPTPIQNWAVLAFSSYVNLAGAPDVPDCIIGQFASVPGPAPISSASEPGVRGRQGAGPAGCVRDCRCG